MITASSMTAFARRRGQTVVGAALLALWALWWLENYLHGRLLMGSATWVVPMPFLGLDFLHNYLAVRYWLTTGNPYLGPFGHPIPIPYNYAPIVLLLFIWCRWVSRWPAVIGWSVVVAAIMAGSAIFTARVRERLGVARISVALAVAVILLTTGTVFSMERGNCDALVVLLLMMAVVALRKRSKTHDAVAGIAMALAALVKVYPALTIFGLLALRRWRATIIAIVAVLVICAITPEPTRQWLHNINVDANRHAMPLKTHATTISGYWYLMFDHAGLRWALHIPPVLGAGIFLVPIIGWVSFAIYRSERGTLLAWPYLLWLTQAATFWSPVTYDYKLLFMPLAILCLWERRSHWVAHALIAPYLICWQPFRISMLGPWLVFAIKIAALVGSGILVQRAARLKSEQSEAA